MSTNRKEHLAREALKQQSCKVNGGLGEIERGINKWKERERWRYGEMRKNTVYRRRLWLY